MVLICTVDMQYVNKCYRIPKELSKMDNPEKLATQGTQNEGKTKQTKTQHNMCWTPPHSNKNK